MATDSQAGNVAPMRLIPRRTIVQGGVALAGGAAAGVLAPRASSAASRREQWRAWVVSRGAGTPVALDDYLPIALTDTEMVTLMAAIDRLIPPDDLGPGASDAGVHVYIDRLLSGRSIAFLPTYQQGLAALNAGGDFAQATPDDQDALLTSAEAGDLADAPAGFFPLLLEHTRQGMFCDPIHGGNREFAGWDLIRYPGIKLVWSADDQAIGAEVPAEHVSVEQYRRQS